MSKFNSLALLSLFQVALLAKEPPLCELKPATRRVEARHIEAKGVGYGQGYTTLEGFFAFPNVWESLVPFVDARGHVFNGGDPATNVGLGLRYLTSHVWGFNAYYDWRRTSHLNYHQISAGFEALGIGKRWDFRLNGYLPVGAKVTHRFHTRFDKFKGNYMYLKSKREFAMKGGNAEVGANLTQWGPAEFYAAVGPYYFEGQGKHAVGGEGRLAMTVYDYFKVQLSGSYDPVFRGIVQGEASVIVPFGGKRKVKPRKGYTCHQEQWIAQKALQRVDRNEIIVLDRKHHHSVAKDPTTGQPLFFLFVDNTSHSAGTFESPFPTFLEALHGSKPGDIFYVFPGDGTPTGLTTASHFKLLDNQQVWGSGFGQSIPTTQGTIHVPAQTKTSPTFLGDSMSSAVFMLANHNTISGLTIDLNSTSSSCISGDTVDGVVIKNNTFNGTVGANGVKITNLGGEGIFKANTMTLSGTTPNGYLISTTGQTSTQFYLDNTFISGDANGIVINANPGSSVTATISNNTLQNLARTGILCIATSGTLRASIKNNVMINNGIEGLNIFTLGSANGSFIVDNNFINHNGSASVIESDSTSSLCLQFTNNRSFTDSFNFNQTGTSTFNLQPTTGNSPTPTLSGNITPVSSGFCPVP